MRSKISYKTNRNTRTKKYILNSAENMAKTEIGSFSRILLEIRFNKKLFYFQWNKVDIRIYNTFIKIHLIIEAELMPIDVSKLYI